MRIDLRQLATENQVTQLNVKFSSENWVEPRKDILSISEVELVCDARVCIGEITFEGHIKFSVNALCSRCVKDITQTIQLPFMARFLQQDSKYIHISEDDFERTVIIGTDIELETYVKEVFYLGFPETFIIRDEQTNACQVCQIDLDAPFDDGQPKRIDPRLAVLQGFVVKQEQ